MTGVFDAAAALTSFPSRPSGARSVANVSSVNVSPRPRWMPSTIGHSQLIFVGVKCAPFGIHIIVVGSRFCSVPESPREVTSTAIGKAPNWSAEVGIETRSIGNDSCHETRSPGDIRPSSFTRCRVDDSTIPKVDLGSASWANW